MNREYMPAFPHFDDNLAIHAGLGKTFEGTGKSREILLSSQ